MAQKYNLKYVISIAFVSALGGLLFGYDWVVIGGAKPFYEAFFGITGIPSLQGWAMSSALIGCVLGAVMAGALSDRYGRKNLLILAAVLFNISAFGTGAANDFFWFILYRILGGLGIGLASSLSPMYIAEISPSAYRGRFVSINQLTIVVGILAAQIINMLIAEPIAKGASALEISNSWNGQSGWRWMFWAELIPAALFLMLMFFVPKSPRFLAKFQKDEEVKRVLSKIGGPQYARSELSAIKLSLQKNKKKKVSYRELWNPQVTPILVVGIVLAVFQQWSGINIIFNYAQEIFQGAGYNVNDMFINIVITGSVNLIFTIVAMNTVDRWGRKPLMLLGSGGLALIYIVIGGMYYLGVTGWPILFMVVAGIAVYAMTLAPITWVILSEIFPNRMRGMAMALATLFLWIASFVLTFTFPILNNKLGASGTFWIYSGICITGFLFIKSRLVETKNKTLEEIEIELIEN